MDSVDFANIQEEIAGRLNQETELVSEQQRQLISAESPLALVSGNYFQVVSWSEQKIFLLKNNIFRNHLTQLAETPPWIS